MRQGFTLVEMLVVVAIIGILAGLISAVAMNAIKKAKRAAVNIEISLIDQTLKAYKDKYGEYPPDGTDMAIDAGTQVPVLVLNHFRRLFPKADLTSNPRGLAQLQMLQTATHIDTSTHISNYNPTTALAFWLGGVPENLANKNSKLIGFSANPLYPLDNTGSRIGPYFEFDSNRLDVPTGATNQMCRTYTANGLNNGYPYVYFRAELSQKGAAPNNTSPFIKGKEVYLMNNYRSVKAVLFNGPNATAIPTVSQLPLSVKAYFDATSINWANPTSYQILFCGFDNSFGRGNIYNTGRWNTSWTNNNSKPANIFYEYNNKSVATEYDPNTLDDQSNFIKGDTIGDDLP
jgi:prepilin-type N-terminal cleavage/methylation domain-containing protein